MWLYMVYLKLVVIINFIRCMLSCSSHVWLFVTPWTVVCQAPLSMGFSRQEYWSGLPHPPPEDLRDAGMKSTSLLSLIFPTLTGRFFTTSATIKKKKKKTHHKLWAILELEFKKCEAKTAALNKMHSIPLHRYFLSTYYAVCQLRGYTEDLEINETLSKHQGAHLLGEISESTQMQNKE